MVRKDFKALKAGLSPVPAGLSPVPALRGVHKGAVGNALVVLES